MAAFREEGKNLATEGESQQGEKKAKLTPVWGFLPPGWRRC